MASGRASRSSFEESSVEGSSKSLTRSWKTIRDAVKKRLEPKSRRGDRSMSGSLSEGTGDNPPLTGSPPSTVKQRLAKGPFAALYNPRSSKDASGPSLLDEVDTREGSQFEMMLDRALSLKRHDSMDLTWRSTDLNLLGTNVQTVAEDENQPRDLVTTERLIVKRASGRAIVNKQYLVIKPLGAGQYGKVQLVVNVADLQPYAMKTVSKAKLRTSIRRIRSSLSRTSRSYGSLHRMESSAVPSVLAEEPSELSTASSSFAGSSASGSPVSLPPLPADISGLFGAAPPNSRFGSGSRRNSLVQPAAGSIPTAPSLSAFEASISASVADSDAASPSAAPAAAPAAVRVKSPSATRPKFVSPFAAAQQASVQAFSSLTDNSSTPFQPASPPRLNRFGLPPTVMELEALSPDTSPTSGAGPTTQDSGPASQPFLSSKHSLAIDRGGIGRPSLEHMAHLRGFHRANSTPNTGLSDSFSMARTASIRVTPRAADVVQEIAVMKKLNHPNIVRLVEVIDDPSTDSLLLVMEHVDGGSLEQPYNADAKTWDTLPEAVVHRYFRELCKGLDYLHYNKALHGDLKPANLLLSSEQLVKIADFGSAMIYQESEGTWEGPINGTPAFRPPETLTASGRLTRKVDVWAAGVCLYVWLWGKLPFQGDSIPDMFTAIRQQPLTFPDSPACHPHLKDLICQILTKEPEARLSLHEVMQHPWVTCQGSQPLPTMADSGLQTVHVTSQDVKSAISPQNRPSISKLQSMFKEVSFKAGDILGLDGAEGEHVFLIAQGQVAVLRSAQDLGTSDLADSEVDDIGSDETLGIMSDKSMSELVGNFHRPSELGSGHVLLATRGPGEFAGLNGLTKEKLSRASRASRSTTDSEVSDGGSPTLIKARTNVLAFQAPKQAIAIAMSQHPELADALQSKAIQHTTDQTMAEAINALHMSHSIQQS